MNIFIAGSVCGDSGYEEEHTVKALQSELKTRGHKVDNLLVPYENDILGMAEQLTAVRLMDIRGADLLVTVGCPAAFLQHVNKRCVLFSLFQGAFEYFGTDYGVPDSVFYARIAGALKSACGKVLQESSYIICGSALLKKDLADLYGIEADHGYFSDFAFREVGLEVPFEKFVVAETDLYPESRFDLLCKALEMCKNNFKFMLFIPRAKKVYREYMDYCLKEHGLYERTIVNDCQIPLHVMEKASCFVSSGYCRRRISGAAALAAVLGKKIIVTADGGAEAELVPRPVEPGEVFIAQAIDAAVENNKTEKNRIDLLTIGGLADRLVGK